MVPTSTWRTPAFAALALVLLGSHPAPPALPAGALPVSDPGPCDAPEADPWVAGQRDRILAGDGLEAFATELFGPHTACVGEVTDVFDGTRFGVVELEHATSAVLRVETLPPESSVVSLRAPGGFPDEQAARDALEAYVLRVGVAPDWSAPEIVRDGEVETRAFTDPDPGLNATAWLVYRGDMLVELRFSLAL